MESLSRYLSISPPFLNPSKPLKPTSKSHILFSNYIPTSPNPSSSPQSITGTQAPRTTLSSHNLLKDSFFLKPHLSFPFLGFSFPFPSLASELTSLPTEEASNKINLESILVSIDNFFNRYPFFVATVTFIWLVVIPLTEEYLQKYKFISAINAFKKLQDDPTCQLLDIRDSRSLGALDSPNLKLLNKSTVQVEFREDDEEGFVKRAVENFGEPADTILCIVDNFDGNSLKAAELLVKNGFKEAYAIRGGLRGEKGWQGIQETLLPLSVRVYPKKGRKRSKPLVTNGGITAVNNDLSPNSNSIADDKSKEVAEEEMVSTSPTVASKSIQRPSSPFPNYPDYKPPSSPTPSKPN